MDVSALKPSSLQSALNTSVAGARDNEARFAQAATDVVNSFAEIGNQLTERFEGARETEQNPQNLTADVAVAANELTADPIKSLVDIKGAQRAYEASLKVFKVADELQQTLLDIKA